MPDAPVTDPWESYWGEQRHSPGAIMWDVEPSEAAERDLPRLTQFFDPELPVIDVGCGNGTQTPFLARHFATVIGTDVSPAAVAIATDAYPEIAFRTLDLMDHAEVGAFHDEVGDANVYIRTVFHQMGPEQQLEAARSVGQLIGATGRCYLIELSSHADEYFQGLMTETGPPEALARVFRHGVTPAIFREDEIDGLFPPESFTILDSGADTAAASHRLPGGDLARVPAFYAVVARAASAA